MEAPAGQQWPMSHAKCAPDPYWVLKEADAVVYALVGLVFLVAAFGMPGFSVAVFLTDERGNTADVGLREYIAP